MRVTYYVMWQGDEWNQSTKCDDGADARTLQRALLLAGAASTYIVAELPSGRRVSIGRKGVK